MSFDNYAALQTSVAGWLARSDLSSVIPDFITLAEQEFGPLLRAKSLRKPVTLASGSDEFALPADVGELRSIRLATDTYKHTLKIGTPETLADFRKDTAGVPQRAAVVGTTLLLDAAPDADMAAEIIYFEKLVPLSDSNATNSVLTDAPNVYLFGALAQAELYLEHDERSAAWLSKMGQGVQALNNQRERQELGAAPAEMRVPVPIG